MMNIRQKKINSFLLSSILIIGIFLIGDNALADDFWANDVIGGIISVFIRILGAILFLVIGVLVEVAQYDLFIKSGAVVNGWIIVRDICNMFFVIILLIIAFATILRLENYSFKKWLPKLMLMAILINFSKTICGVLIDVAQIVMLTFVNAFKDIAAGNIIEMLGIVEVVNMAKESEEAGFGTIVGAYVLGLIYMIVSLIVIIAMLAMLVMRIVMIWVYVVLSPLAYLLAAFPGGQSYAKKWWTQFTQNLIVGPVLAFFIWLSFAALQTQVYTPASDTAFLGSEASTPGVLIKFVIAIGMLIAGLKIASEIGGEAGKMAGKGMDAVSKGQRMVTGGGKKLLGGIGIAAKQPFSWTADKIHQRTGVDLKLGRAWKTMQHKRAENKAKRYGDGKLAAQKAMQEGSWAHSVLAMTGNADDAWEHMTSWKGFKKRIFRAPGAMKRKREEALPGLKRAETELENASFEKQFTNKDKVGRESILKKLEEQIELKDVQIEIEEEKPDKEKNQQLINDLKAAREIFSEKKKFVDKNIDHDFTEEEKKEKEKAYKEAKTVRDENRKVVEANTPEYHFEARATEQALVNAELAKIKDISDPTELRKINRDAIHARDKSLSKAAMLKMTKDYNDNEFLQELAGRTDYKGLQQLMRDLADPKSKNYGGYTQQEAFALGSQIAEINKVTNHWAATSSFLMDNGAFRETTDEEHFRIRDIEMGKIQMQGLARNANRLADGRHDEFGDYHIDLGGIMMMMKFDSPDGHSNIRTMNESKAKHWYDAIMSNKVLKERFEERAGTVGESLVEALKKRLGEIAKDSFERKLSTVMLAEKGKGSLIDDSADTQSPDGAGYTTTST